MCFLRPSVLVHLPDFICPNSNNKKKIEFFFRAFSKIMGTIFGCKWHFPSSDLKYDTVHMTRRSAKKEEIDQEESRCRRKMVKIDHAAPSRSLYEHFEQMTYYVTL